MGCAFDNPQCRVNQCQKRQSEDLTNFFIINNYKPDNNQPKPLGLTINRIHSYSNNKSEIQTIDKSSLNKQINFYEIVKTTNYLISYPRIKLFIFRNDSLSLLNTISLTPNSMQINNNPIKVFANPVKFTFGKDIKNDCALNDESIGPNQFHIIHLNQKYYIIDNHNGTGLFCKIIGKKIIDHDLRIGFGGDYMLIKVRLNCFGGKDIKIIFCLKKDLEYQFNSNKKEIITIGRNKKCDICYQEESISKVQCTIVFLKDNWIIMDGSYGLHKQKLSTNGIWLLAKKGIEIKKDMIFKTGALKITVDNDNATESSDETNHLHNNNNSSLIKDSDH